MTANRRRRERLVHQVTMERLRWATEDGDAQKQKDLVTDLRVHLLRFFAFTEEETRPIFRVFGKLPSIVNVMI